MVDISKITTEGSNNRTENLDNISILDQVKLLNSEDKLIADAVYKESENISKLVEEVVRIVKNGGKIFYMGAGTSGRLGILDASEILPTYGEGEIFYGLIAGGRIAIETPVENAEDNKEFAIQDIKDAKITSKDMIIGLSASGRTPYVVAALEYANKNNISTGSLATSNDSEISKLAKFPIEVFVGPEAIVGSTRMKSGTAQKMVLNMISSLAMVNIGKVYKNYMVDVVATNEKLRWRAIKMISRLTNADEQKSKELFEASNNNVKIATVMFYKNTNREEAIKLLENNNNKLRGLID